MPLFFCPNLIFKNFQKLDFNLSKNQYVFGKVFLVLFICIFINSCQNTPKEESTESKTPIPTQKEAFQDKRDGNVYPTIQIGNQVWFGKNLNFKTDSSWCIDNEPKNCDKLGRLYAWNQARNACPQGWHLPTKEDWQKLVRNYSNAQNLDNEGDRKIFEALYYGGESKLDMPLSGFYNSATERFIGFEKHGSYWSSTKFGLQAATCALISQTNYGDYFFMFTPGSQDAGHACRCVKD